MGHSEMLLAVAGLKPEEVKALTKKLASGDWSSFLPPPGRLMIYLAVFLLGYLLAGLRSAWESGRVIEAVVRRELSG